MVDPIADMLSRIRNAIMAQKEEVILPYSKIKFEMAKILDNHKVISSLETIEPIKTHRSKEETNHFKQIKIKLAYDENGQPLITNLRRVSKPGQKIYIKKDNMPRVLDGLGFAIISTSQGLMSDQEAKKRKIGGELLCEIW